jgi:FKBP-type peptidyl-prolyl cis-trans isomerase FkpA
MLIAKNHLIIAGMVVMSCMLFFACTGKKHNEQRQEFNPNVYKEPLIRVNKQVSKNEDELIDDFVKRYGWHMLKTGTGLRYMVYSDGHGDQIHMGDSVKINYSVMLLNGDSVYSSEKDGPREIVIGASDVESGLEEGILLLHGGDKAKFIIPSHLAYSLLGDLNKIPPKATLVYDIEITGIKKNGPATYNPK